MRRTQLSRLFGLAIMTLVLGTACFGSKNAKIKNAIEGREAAETALVERQGDLVVMTARVEVLEQNIVDLGNVPFEVPGKYWKSIDSCKKGLPRKTDWSVHSWVMEGKEADCIRPALTPSS